MRVAALAIVGVLAATSALAQYDFLDTFTYADGAFPSAWFWTGDPQGGGQFLVNEGRFAHTSGGSVYYFRDTGSWSSDCYQGWYEFDVKDSYWEFAWEISGTAASGECCRLYHNDAWGQWGYTVTESTWSTLPGFPDGQYMFHNSTDLTRRHTWTGPVAGWHHVCIEDIFAYVVITVDGQPIFDFEHYSTRPGKVGIGASAGSGTLAPAFDNVRFQDFDSSVESRSWGAIKALFR